MLSCMLITPTLPSYSIQLAYEQQRWHQSDRSFEPPTHITSLGRHFQIHFTQMVSLSIEVHVILRVTSSD